MKKTLNLILRPEEAFDEAQFQAAVLKRAKVSDSTAQVRALKRSIDARSKNVKVNVQALVSVQEELPPVISYQRDYPNVKNAEPVIIVGFGPAGMFAALRCVELGFKPIVIERGSDVRNRRRDLAAINKEQTVNPESNYCFGEGGAGTYSDGKLYTRSKKRGDIQKSLEILVAHGATDQILVDSHPHIGTNKLPKVVQEIRESILGAGGEIHFDTKMTDFVLDGDEMKGVVLGDGTKLTGLGVILATGHSARDIFHLLHQKQVFIEAKPFALGVRIEHPQALIDKIQYHCETDRGPWLPASSYALVHQTYFDNKQRGVFSFCMCPGGFIVPAATAPGEVVVNGMSPSRRDSKFANSGIVTAIELEDLKAYEKFGPLAGLAFQQEVEQRACNVAGGTQVAPAQRMVDFVQNKVSGSLNDTSYQPGLASVSMNEVLPDFVHERLRKAFKAFGKKMNGYYTNEAQIVGVESRTSSPVRIPRDRGTCEHVQIKRLFPCGEGAGYAGGILSAAMDGEKCADALISLYKKA
ncbi:NAD(P)/FAD-dependent oxidoreductase [Roseivirga pacifica]|uniref:NAD(P)/FAD-dependent oxidoreductase n=1 Tax=Roseivirga pacifica TaxID=1267423 RepID=UPI0020950F57|nr:FAD-binding protein [Roseivirga pacifica]MCO6357244.1 FAD-binding protein [Roseivirga pacifica]MCO6368042.1 FAD-binding protein [Roseivirga pacifica]MCO6369476.1 FAD-binding protein [Roseivirga pacifica]MCO6373330.1 FAD-binding protein [Roseivirga pacifica]MCO6377413.1 FAD-binding protein [Roseivirga pacifica]